MKTDTHWQKRYLRSAAHEVDCSWVPCSAEPRTGSRTSQKMSTAHTTPSPGVNYNTHTHHRQQLSIPLSQAPFFKSVLHASSCFHSLLPIPRDPTVTTRLQFAYEFPRLPSHARKYSCALAHYQISLVPLYILLCLKYCAVCSNDHRSEKKLCYGRGTAQHASQYS